MLFFAFAYYVTFKWEPAYRFLCGGDAGYILHKNAFQSIQQLQESLYKLQVLLKPYQTIIIVPFFTGYSYAYDFVYKFKSIITVVSISIRYLHQTDFIDCIL